MSGSFLECSLPPHSHKLGPRQVLSTWLLNWFGCRHATYFFEISFSFYFSKQISRDFPGGAVIKNPPANAGDTGSSPGLGRSHMPWSN